MSSLRASMSLWEAISSADRWNRYDTISFYTGQDVTEQVVERGTGF